MTHSFDGRIPHTPTNGKIRPQLTHIQHYDMKKNAFKDTCLLERTFPLSSVHPSLEHVI